MTHVIQVCGPFRSSRVFIVNTCPDEIAESPPLALQRRVSRSCVFSHRVEGWHWTLPLSPDLAVARPYTRLNPSRVGQTLEVLRLAYCGLTSGAANPNPHTPTPVYIYINIHVYMKIFKFSFFTYFYVHIYIYINIYI